MIFLSSTETTGYCVRRSSRGHERHMKREKRKLPSFLRFNPAGLIQPVSCGLKLPFSQIILDDQWSVRLS